MRDGKPSTAAIYPWWLLLLLAIGGHAQAALRVAVISDLNSAYGSTSYEQGVDAAIQRIVALRPDLVISTGDMVAGQRRPHLSREEVEAMWRAFDLHVASPLAAAGIPLAVTPGNHDASAYSGFQLERRLYAEHWANPHPDLQYLDLAGFPFYYAFALGDALFVGLDATVVGQLTQRQMQWLQEVLAGHGQAYRRRVLFSHLPLWPVAQGREREYIGDPALQALLATAKVDVFLSGHHHAFYPGALDGVIHLSQACLGAGPRRLIGVTNRSQRAFTVLDLGDSEIAIAAIEGPRFDTPLDWRSLPERIGAAGTALIRADLSGTPVRPLRSGEITPVRHVPAALQSQGGDQVGNGGG